MWAKGQSRGERTFGNSSCNEIREALGTWARNFSAIFFWVTFMNFCTSPTPCPPTGTRTQSVTPKRTSQFPGRVSDSSALKLVFALAVFPPPPVDALQHRSSKRGFWPPLLSILLLFFLCVSSFVRTQPKRCSHPLFYPSVSHHSNTAVPVPSCPPRLTRPPKTTGYFKQGLVGTNQLRWWS